MRTAEAIRVDIARNSESLAALDVQREKLRIRGEELEKEFNAPLGWVLVTHLNSGKDGKKEIVPISYASVQIDGNGRILLGFDQYYSRLSVCQLQLARHSNDIARWGDRHYVSYTEHPGDDPIVLVLESNDHLEGDYRIRFFKTREAVGKARDTVYNHIIPR